MKSAADSDIVRPRAFSTTTSTYGHAKRSVVRAEIRARYFSRRTADAYVHWIRRFIVFHGRRHPRELGAREISAFVTWLAVERHAAAWSSCYRGRGCRRRYRSSSALPRYKHAHPLASRHVYVRPLATIHVAAGIVCDRILSERVLICLPTVG